MCNLYNLTRAVDAMRQMFAPSDLNAGSTNLEPLPAIYPDQRAPVVVREGEKLQMITARWGLPTPAQYLVGKHVDRGVTNVRNAQSPHWRPWLVPENRCVVPFDQFAEPATGGRNVWFEMTTGAGVFAGIVVRDWKSTRKVAEGETTNDLYGFLTTEPNRLVGIYHPKAMPVILTDKSECELWLNGPWPEAAKLQRPLAECFLRTVEKDGRPKALDR